MPYDEHTWGMDITVGWYVVVTDYGKQDHHQAVSVSVFLTNEYGNLILPTPIWVTNDSECSIYNAMTAIGYPVVRSKSETPYFVDCPELGQKVKVYCNDDGLYNAWTTKDTDGVGSGAYGKTPELAIQHLIDHVYKNIKDNSPAFAKFVSAMYRNEIKDQLAGIKEDIAGLKKVAIGSVQLDDLTVKSLEAVERNITEIKKRLTALESAHDCEKH
jgi:hypothetical protein